MENVYSIESLSKTEAFEEVYEDLEVEKELLPADRIEKNQFFMGLFFGSLLGIILWCFILLTIKLINSI